VCGVFPLYLLKDEELETREENSTSGIFNFAPRAPMLLACVFAFAIFDAATLSLLPVYGIRNGLDISTAALVLTALIVGNTILQFPIGWLADKYPHRLVLAGCALVTVIMLGTLPLVIATPLMWPVLILAGACGYGIYTVSLTSLGSRFQGVELINGAAAFAVMWGIGALIGSISGGWAMELFGPHGLPVHLMGVFLLLALGLGMRGYLLSRRSSNARR
jgi:MFS family permease